MAAEIGSQRKLETALLRLMEKAVVEGLRFEVALQKARKRYIAKIPTDEES